MESNLQILLFVSVLVGIGLVIFSLINVTQGDDTNPHANFEADNTIKAIESSIEEADRAMEELNKFSSQLFEEIDNKYQELLFLYNLLDEKKRDIVPEYTQKPATVTSRKEEASVKNKQIPANPKMTEINALKEKGLSVAEIAKALNLGQGEVKLMLELYKS